MKVQLSAKSLRIRLNQQEFQQLQHEPIILDCEGWVFRLQTNPVGLTSLLGWPFHPVLTLGFKDYSDWMQEPENGIVLAEVTPRCELDVDYKKPSS